MKKFNEKQTETINQIYDIVNQVQDEQYWIEIAYHYCQSDDKDTKGKCELLLELILQKHGMLNGNINDYWTKLKNIL